MESNKCIVKSCRVNLVLHDLYMAPEDPVMLKNWQEVLITTDSAFYVCSKHFSQKDFEKNLAEDAIPALYLSDEVIKLENDCCGLCLKETEDKFKISSDLGELGDLGEIFREISGYEVNLRK